MKVTWKIALDVVLVALVAWVVVLSNGEAKMSSAQEAEFLQEISREPAGENANLMNFSKAAENFLKFIQSDSFSAKTCGDSLRTAFNEVFMFSSENFDIPKAQQDSKRIVDLLEKSDVALQEKIKTFSIEGHEECFKNAQDILRVSNFAKNYFRSGILRDDLVKDVSLTLVESWILQKKYHNKVSQVETRRIMGRVLVMLNQNAFEKRGFGLTPKEMIDKMEEVRKKDLRKWQNAEATLFHYAFRPKV